MTIDAGDKFHCTEIMELTTGRGKVLARYRPGYVYEVTQLNLTFLREAEAAGTIVKGVPPGSEAGISLAQVAGTVTTTEPPAKKGKGRK